jgi:hypothetical protein
MSIADELRKLQELRSSGAITEEEFIQAKAAVLKDSSQSPGGTTPESPSLFPIDPAEFLSESRLRVMRLIAGALVAGVVVFLAIAAYVVRVQNHGQGLAPPPVQPVITYTAAATFAISAPLALIIPRLQTRTALRAILAGTWASAGTFRTGGSKLWALAQTTMIVGLALLEGPALLACMAYLLEGNPLALGVGGAAIVLMLCKFPTEQRVGAWLERHAEALEELRQQRDAATP